MAFFIVGTRDIDKIYAVKEHLFKDGVLFCGKVCSFDTRGERGTVPPLRRGGVNLHRVYTDRVGAFEGFGEPSSG
jgi:hypothetical protein